MSGENSASNNWTILTPEEPAAEALRPLAEGTEHHEPDSGASQTAGGEASSSGSPVEEHMVSSSSVSVSDAHEHTEGPPEGPAQPSPDPESFSDSYTHITPPSDEASEPQPNTETLRGGDFNPEEQRQIEEEEEEEASPSHERLQQEDGGSGPSSRIPTSAQQEGEKSERPEKGDDPELRRRKNLLASLEEIGTKEEEEEEEEEEEREEEFQVPQREEDGGITLNKCIIGAVILLGLGTIFISGVLMDLDQEADFGKREFADAEAAGKQEWFSKEAPPPPADADATELLNHLAKGNVQVSVLQAQLQAQNEELKVAKEQIADAAKERLLWEEMGEENSRLKTQAASLSLLQNENERMKRELESVRSLQQEVETLRSTVTELKRSSAGEAGRPPVKTHATSPFSGQAENGRQDASARKVWSNQREKKEKYDTGENKPWKEKSERQEGEKRKRKEGDKKEWVKEKHEQRRRSDREKDGEGKQKRHGEETERWKKNESKKDKKGRGDEGKPWKDRSERREETEKSERKNHKETKDWRKGKHQKVKEGEEEKDWKRAKDHREKHVGREDRKEEKEWKKVHGGLKEGGKEKWEKDWKKGERKEWKKDGEWSDKSGKDAGKERKHQGERKPLGGSEHHSKRHSSERSRNDERPHWEEDEWTRSQGKEVKERKRKDEGNQWEKRRENGKRGQEEVGHGEDRRKDRSSSQKHKDKQKTPGVHHHGESLWTEDSAPKKPRRPSLGQPEYWARQRERLLHSPTPPQDCETPEACATTDGLLPVPYAEFDAVLQKYISKAEEAGVDASKREELRKLAAEFFKDGVFAHNQMSFHDFVDDLGDILEDMAEEEEDGDDQEEDGVLEDEMEEFEREVLRKFSVAAGANAEGRVKEELKTESGRGRG